MKYDGRSQRFLILPLLVALITMPALPVKAHMGGKPDQPQAQADSQNGPPLLVSEITKRLLGPPQALFEYLFAGLGKQIEMNGRVGKMSFHFEVVETLPNAALSRLTPQLAPDGEVRLKLVMTKAGVNNPLVVQEELLRLQQLVPQSEYLALDDVSGRRLNVSVASVLGLDEAFLRTPALQWIESKLNQAAGSAAFDRELTASELKLLSAVSVTTSDFKLFEGRGDLRPAIAEAARAHGIQVDGTMEQGQVLKQYFKMRNDQLIEALVKKTELAKEDWSRKKKAHEEPSAKALRDRLEAMPEKLNDLVKKNDREGVAKLLEAFLPLKEMEPTELALWTEWIEAIRHPDFSNAVVLFRGLDKFDKPQAASGADTQAAKPGFFSTLLTRNQGNFTRRLRSLTSSRLKPASLDGSKEVAPFEKAPAVTKAMFAHSKVPVASPFLSFTTVPAIALEFGSHGYLAARIDKRRALPNSLSEHQVEMEYLVPLIVFPDEVVEHHQGRISRADLKGMVERVNTQFGLELTERRDSVNLQEMHTRSQWMFGRAASWLKSGGLCRRLFK